jgi:galactokinase
MVRVQQGIKALMRGDAIAFGEHMKESYWSARDLYGSSSPALDIMWQVAEQHPGCYGARYSGSGEGGSIIALVDTNAVDDFIRHTEATYEHATGIAPEVFAVTPAECAGVFI